jgi:hypothetical protein
LLLILVTLPRNTKSSEIFKLSSLCHISIKVEAMKSKNTLTQCYNCQQFGHIWANCKQPSRFYGVGAATCIKEIQLRLRCAATASWRKERNHIPPTTADLGCQGRAAEEEAAGNTQNHFWKNILIQICNTAPVLRGDVPRPG